MEPLPTEVVLKLQAEGARPHGAPHMEDLVGDFGRGAKVPGDDGAVSGVPGGGVCAAQELGALLQEQDVQGLLDGRFVASHHLQGYTPLRLAGQGCTDHMSSLSSPKFQ